MVQPPTLPEQPSSIEMLSEHQREELRRITAEYARRDMEAIRIYEPTGQAAPFHKCTARERTCRGSNRAGKTLAAAMEVAMAVTGQHPHLPYPKENGVAILVGKNDVHVATVFYKMLCKPGAFKMIRDLKTGAWRAYRPWLEEDAERKDQVKNAPPLIPRRMIKGGHKGIAWEDQKKKVFKMIPLTNGWEIWAHPSGGEPPQGVAVDLVWMDEHITNPEWYDEMSARLLDRHGVFIWSATPQSFNPQLLDLSQEYERLMKEGVKNPRVVEFKFLLKDNPHIDKEEQRILEEKYAGNEQAYRVRIMGEFASMGYLMYPNFCLGTHGMDRSELPENEVPAVWCRYMIVDPGHTTAAVLFAAVPPPGTKYGDIVLVYDELYITGCDGAKFGKEVAEKVGHQWFWEFLIDKKGAQPTSGGDGRPIEWHYEQALKQRSVRSQQTGYSFIPGLAKVEQRCEHVRGWLGRRDDGTVKLKVLRDELPHFEREISRYRKNMTPKGIIEDKPAPRQADHLMNCVSANTEVLTKAGWKLFPDVTFDDELATVNLDTDALEYQQPTRLINKHHSGEMFHFSGHKMDAMFTPGHRMVTCERDGVGGEIKAAEDVGIWDLLKLRANWSGESPEVVLVSQVHNAKGLEKELDPGNFAEFLGWYIAEGHCDTRPKCPGNGYRVGVAQSREPHRSILKALLEQLPWKWASHESGFSCSSKQLWTYLSPLGDCYSKSVPTWIKESGTEVIRRFVMGAMFGDGNVQNGRRNYCTVSSRLADDMQELFIKLGRTASVRVKKAGTYTIDGRSGLTKEQFFVSEWITPTAGLRDRKNRPNFKLVPYEGRVYCATVPNGTLVFRRNGKPIVAGNCLEYLAAHNPDWNPTKEPPRTKSKALRAFNAFTKRGNKDKSNTVVFS